MRSYLKQIDVIYNDINAPIGSGGCIVDKYPDWLEENTLWKVNTRNKSFPVRFQVPAYYELAKASYLELFEQDSLPEWTVHQFKRYDYLLSNIAKRRLNQFWEQERKIQEEEEEDLLTEEEDLLTEEEEDLLTEEEEDLLTEEEDDLLLTEEEDEEENHDEENHEFNLDEIEKKEEQEQHWLFRYLSWLIK